MQKCIRFNWLALVFSPCLCFAFSKSVETELFLKTAFGYGQFLYSDFEAPPKYTIYDEQFSEISALFQPDMEKQFQYGLGLGGHRFSTLQKTCTSLSCQDADTPNDQTTKVFLSPYFSFDWKNYGLLLGIHNIGISENAVQPRLGLRLGPLDRVYFSLDCLNGQSLLTEGLISLGLGSKIKQTEVWLGWSFWPYHGPGISGKVSRKFGIFYPSLTGHLGSANQDYHSAEDNYPPVQAKLFEYGISLGLGIRIK